MNYNIVINASNVQIEEYKCEVKIQLSYANIKLIQRNYCLSNKL